MVRPISNAFANRRFIVVSHGHLYIYILRTCLSAVYRSSLFISAVFKEKDSISSAFVLILFSTHVFNQVLFVSFLNKICFNYICGLPLRVLILFVINDNVHIETDE